MTDYCEQFDLPVSGCAHCRGIANTAARSTGSTVGHQRLLAQRAVFPARFDGRCPACPDRISEGDMITASDDGYVHEGCA